MSATADMTAAHVLWAYLPRTQTFVYELLTHFTRVRSVVVTDKLENLDLFPYADVRKVPERSLPARAADKAAFASSGRRPFRERNYRDAVSDAGAWLLHGHFGWSAPLTLPLKRDLGLPLVTTFYGHDMSATLTLAPDMAETYRELFETGEVFLVEGNHMKRGLVELGCPAEKLRVQRIGVDLTKVKHAEAVADQSEPLTVLMCGSFLEKKGIRYGIEAAAKAVRERSGIRLQVVGDGPERAEYEALIEELGAADVVELLGYRTHDEYLELARHAQIFMAPSVTAANGETEGGAPTVLLEMQAACLPVVSTRHADIPEVVVDGESGFLAPERDSDALAERLLELADDPDLRVRMGLRGREHVRENHDIVKQVRALEDIYEGAAA